MSRKNPGPREPSSSDEEIAEEEDESTVSDEVDPIEFIQSLPVQKRRRLYAVKGLTARYRAARKSLRADLDKLDADFMKQLEPLFEQRRSIVNGVRDVTVEESAAAAAADSSRVEEIADEEEQKAQEKKSGVVGAAAAAAASGNKKVKITSPNDSRAKAILEQAAASPTGGIPGFWLGALRNNEVCDAMIQERDEDALLHLIDIVATDLPPASADSTAPAGFQLHFHFDDKNPYFTDRVLTATFGMSAPKDGDDGDEGSIESHTGCPINWTSREKTLILQVKSKKQRHKSGAVRVVEREERSPSFFWFFHPPVLGNEDDEEPPALPAFYPKYAARKEDEESDDMGAGEEAELYEEAGMAIYTSVVRRAAYSYAGLSVQDIARGILEHGNDYGDDDEDEEEFEEESESDEEEPQPVANKKKGGNAGGKSAPKPSNKPAPKECKNQ